jgi:UDP-glucose 4-epimerase
LTKYLVTGVAGFVGSAIASRLIKEGCQVVGVDNLSTGFIDNVPSGVEFYKAGIHESEVFELLKNHNFDAIFHIAGQSGGEPSYADPIYDLQSNAQSTVLLLKFALESGCKKIIYAGTVSIYGEPDKPYEILESEEAMPSSFYGVGKLASEHYLRIYAEQFGIDTVSLRLFNIYGPGQNLDNLQQGMTSIFLSQALRSKRIHIRGSRDRFRDLVYIDDTVEAFITVLSDKFKGYNVYNICTGKPTTVETIVDEIRTNLPFNVSVCYDDVRSTPGDVFGYTGSASKFMSESRWKPVTSVKDGIKIMVKLAIKKEEMS